MSDSSIEEIKSRLDIVGLVSEYLKLQKAGVNYRALCPFHSEKNPSFFVSPTRQIWHCFSCGKGGDIFKFVMEIEGLEFYEALEKLAQKAGVVLKKGNFAQKSEKKKLYEILETTTDFFEKNLENQKEVLNYLKLRGLKDETIREFRLGYSRPFSTDLMKFLKSKDYYERDIEKTGLIILGENGYYNRFRDRIMFPIFNLTGNVIGFGGRIFSKSKNELAKYINSPNTLIYDKSRVLYGLNKAQIEIRKNDFCILVEGYMDLILSYQAGIKNVVAASGTALSDHQLNLLSRYSKNLYISFDMDSAGDTATKRTIDLARKLGFNIKVIILPSGKDPADLIKENPTLWKKAIEKAKSIMEFYFESVFSKYNADNLEDKKKITEEILFQIKKIQNKVEEAYWLRELSEKINIPENFLKEELDKIDLNSLEERPSFKNNSFKFSIVENIDLSKNYLQNLAERLLILVLKNPQYLSCLDDFQKDDIVRKVFKDFKLTGFNNKTLDFIELVDKILSCQKELDFKVLKKKEKEGKISKQNKEKNSFLIEVVKNKTEKSVSKFLDKILFKDECFSFEISKEDIEKEIKFCRYEIQARLIQERLSQINISIKKAEKESDTKKLKNLLNQFNGLSQKLSEIKKAF